MNVGTTLRRLLWCAVLLAVAPASGEAREASTDAADTAVIRVANLPPEARHTLQLIERAGPFPYAKDGAVFGNREARLPRKPHGYYREYTVPTPGAADRGARRIIAGQGAERYYTDNHYRSFRRIIE